MIMAALRRSTRVKKEALDIIAPQSNGIKKAAAPKVSRAKSDSATATSKSNGTFVVPEVPTTPKRKRTSKATKVPPITPTPSAIGLISAPYSTDVTSSPAKDRPVEPHVTNAPLRTPGGTTVVAYRNDVDSSPSKTGLPRPSTTTGNVLEEACAHLVKTDPSLKDLISQHHCRMFSPEGLAEEIEPFNALASGIISQQVSGAAARSIKRKFMLLFHEGKEGVEGEDLKFPTPQQVAGTSLETLRTAGLSGREGEDLKFPTPQQVAGTSLETLRTAGLSGRKAEYIQGLAEKFASGELGTEMLVRASTEECLEKLIAVRGLGKCEFTRLLTRLQRT
jgi:DNA-3-methyladenine glycosylase II